MQCFLKIFRYLPSSVVEQDVRIKLLNEHSHEDDEEEVTTEDPVTRPRTSTESLIDKLDQVQSDFSSGLLTGNDKDYPKNSFNNNINSA